MAKYAHSDGLFIRPVVGTFHETKHSQVEEPEGNPDTYYWTDMFKTNFKVKELQEKKFNRSKLDYEQIKGLIEMGLSGVKIALLLGKSKSTIQDFIRKHNLAKFYPPKTPQRTELERFKDIKDAMDKGYSFSRSFVVAGVTYAGDVVERCRKWLTEQGIDYKKNGKEILQKKKIFIK
jgi:transposase